MNRGIALAELHGTEAGRAALEPLQEDPKLARYSFYWASLADLERRAQRPRTARALYEKALNLAHSRAERLSYEARLRQLLD